MSCSRAVLQSCSRAVVLPLLAFTIQIIAPTVSLADEGVPQQPVLVDRSEPGVLVFDGSDNRSFLPLLDEIREFPDLASYLEFVYSTFNFAVDEVVQEGEASSLNIIQYGTLYTYTEDLTNLIPVSNAVATLIGGRYGKVIVDGTEYCIDFDRCEESVDPYTLQEMEFSASQTFWPDDEEVDSGSGHLQNSSLAPLNYVPFRVRGELSFERPKTVTAPFPGGGVAIRSTAAATSKVVQVSGGVRYLPYMTVQWEPTCGVISWLGDGCFLMPTYVRAVTDGENRLSATLGTFYASYWNRHERKCEVSRLSFNRTSVGSNIPEAKYEHRQYFNGATLPELYAHKRWRTVFFPEMISGNFKAWDHPEPWLINLHPRQQGFMLMQTGISPECK